MEINDLVKKCALYAWVNLGILLNSAEVDGNVDQHVDFPLFYLRDMHVVDAQHRHKNEGQGRAYYKRKI